MFKTDNIQTVQSVLTVSAGKMQNSVLFARLGETKVCILSITNRIICAHLCASHIYAQLNTHYKLKTNKDNKNFFGQFTQIGTENLSIN